MQQYAKRSSAAFTLVELMIVVAIIGLLVSIAIPNFKRFQLRARSTEAKTVLAGIRIAEEAYSAEFGVYIAAAPNPAVIPGSVKGVFAPSVGFDTIGFDPGGRVSFSYGVSVAVNASGFTADAGADIDEDGVIQYWAYAKPATDGSVTAAVVGCNVAVIELQKVTPCTPASGQSVF